MADNPKAKAKKLAAHSAVEDHIRSNQVLGIGSGSTIVYAIEKIAELYASKAIKDIICVPTSFQSEQLILHHKLPLGNLKQHWQIDVAIDGADEVDAKLNLIKGGGGCHLQEKMVAFNAKKLVIIADYTKQSVYLCTSFKKGVPLSFKPDSISYVGYYVVKHLTDKVQNLRHRDIHCVLRMANNKAGPVITDGGHMIYDINFDGILQCDDIQSIDSVLRAIPGVVESGLFPKMAHVVYFGQMDGSVIKQTRDVVTVKHRPRTQSENEDIKFTEQMLDELAVSK
eukprot:201938_1